MTTLTADQRADLNAAYCRAVIDQSGWRLCGPPGPRRDDPSGGGGGMSGVQVATEAERFEAWLLERHPDAQVHWYVPKVRDWCEEYWTGDALIDHDRAAVTCQECLEWMHA